MLLALITVAAALVVTAIFPTLNGEVIVAVVGLFIVVNAAIVTIAMLGANNHRAPASGDEGSDR